MDLQEYNFMIKHRPGKANTKADLLSRRAGCPKGENDNEEHHSLKRKSFQKNRNKTKRRKQRMAGSTIGNKENSLTILRQTSRTGNKTKRSQL
jgi:hypothetical protein